MIDFADEQTQILDKAFQKNNNLKLDEKPQDKPRSG